MNILNRFFGSKNKQSLAVNQGFARLQIEEMDTVLGGRPAGPIASSLDADFNRMNAQTNRSSSASPENGY